MKNVLILGASGMVGGEVLRCCLDSAEVDNVIAIVRSPLNLKHEKLQEVIHQDYNNYDAIKTYLKYVDVCFFCIGVYTGAVSKEVFHQITVDMPVALGSALKKESPDVSFCLLSGMGADPTETSRMLFAKAKGIAENQLQSLDFKRLHIFRPGYIYPTRPRKSPNIWYRLFKGLYKPLRGILRQSSVTSQQLAERMLEVALDANNSQIILENKDIIK